MEYIESIFLAQEGDIEKAKHFVDQILQANVSFVPSSFSNTNYTRTKPFSSNYTSDNDKQRFSSKPRFSNSKNYKKMPPNTFSSCVSSQICEKTRHTTLHCRHKFDTSSHSQVIANTTHFALSLSDDEPSILGTPSSLHDPLGYLDSGASHHLTARNTNLSTKTPYIGSENVVIGNGSRLPINFKHLLFYQLDYNSFNGVFLSILRVKGSASSLIFNLIGLG